MNRTDVVAVARRVACALGLLLIRAPLPRVVSAQGGGTVRGVVTSAESHDPIAAARVAVDQPERVTLTDSHGNYVLRDLPGGSHTLTITALGRKPARLTVNVVTGQSASQDAALEAGPLLLSGLIVTATRLATEANHVASTINVLTPEQIATSPARESQDMLREIPGVELPRTSSLVGGTAQIVSIRGVDEGRTVVLFDGIPAGDAWGEWIDWGRVPKGTLDRVEVLEGGTSNLYGNGAIGGVISFFSRPLAPGSGIMTLEGGSRDTGHAFLSMGGPVYGASSANVSGDYQDGGGYTLLDPTKRGAVDVASEIVQRNGFLRLNYNPSARLAVFATGHLFGDTRHIGTPLGRQTRDFKSLDLGLNYGAAQTGLLSIRAWDGHQEERQRSAAVRANSSSCTEPSTAPRACEDSSVLARIPSHDWGASALWTRQDFLALESFTVGADFRHMNGSFDETDFNTTSPGVTCGAVLRTVQSGGDQDLSGAFVQAIAAPWTPLHVELSARVDRWGNNNGHSNDALDGNTSYPDRTKTAFSP